MRILSFSKKWQKLEKDIFTTFRFKRRDADWEVGEVVQVFYKTRTPERELLGTARITAKEPRWMLNILGSLRGIEAVSDKEAIEDGFESKRAMLNWLTSQHEGRIQEEPMNKLTLECL